MVTEVTCPDCGAAMREIVWGYGTLADVTEAGDVVVGGCVVDVDATGRVAALQCSACGTRTDAAGTALERPELPAEGQHPFAVTFSNPVPPKRGGGEPADEAAGELGDEAAAEPADEPAGPIDQPDEHALDTSDFTDAEEEGWPPPADDWQPARQDVSPRREG